MKRDTARFALGSAIVAVGALIVLGLFAIVVPESNQRIMDLASGIVLGWGGSVVNFYFGTSESSAHKTEIMAAQAMDDPGPQRVEVVNPPENPVPTQDTTT